ncbi:MAG: amidohydrolase family protein [Planctomycetota bacterium]
MSNTPEERMPGPRQPLDRRDFLRTTVEATLGGGLVGSGLVRGGLVGGGLVGGMGQFTPEWGCWSGEEARGPLPEPPPTWRCLDIHVHVAGVGAGGSGCFVRKDVLDSLKFRFFCLVTGMRRDRLDEADSLYVARLLDLIRSSKRIDQAVILALDGVLDRDGRLDRDRTAFYVPNDYVLSLAREHQELLAGASIHPGRPEALDELERVAAEGAVLVKWLPNSQGIRPDDKAYCPFYRKLASLRLPLLTHTGREYTLETIDQSLGDPSRLELALEEGVTVIAAHAASQGRDESSSHFDRLLELIERYPRLYMDISALTLIHRAWALVRLASRTDLHDRLVYGSDYPVPCFPPLAPFYFPRRIPLERMFELQALDNVLQRDVDIKRALGVPAAIFARGYELIRRPA